MVKTARKIKVIFRQPQGRVAKKYFTSEDEARDFAQKHPDSCVIIDWRRNCKFKKGGKKNE